MRNGRKNYPVKRNGGRQEKNREGQTTSGDVVHTIHAPLTSQNSRLLTHLLQDVSLEYIVIFGIFRVRPLMSLKSSRISSDMKGSTPLNRKKRDQISTHANIRVLSKTIRMIKFVFRILNQNHVTDQEEQMFQETFNFTQRSFEI